MTRMYASLHPDQDLSILDQRAQQAFEEGLSCEMKGNLKAALSAFKQAALLAPGEPRPLLAIGHTYEALGKVAQAAVWYLRAEEMGDVGSSPPVQAPDPVSDPAPATAQEPPSYQAWLAGLNPNGLPDEEVGGTVGELKALLARYGPDPLALRKLALLVARLGDIKRAGGYILEADWAKQRGTSWR